MHSMKDKIHGIFLGCYLGDRSGMPVEGWTSDEIARKYGRISSLLPNGRTTDDWQLTKAVAEGLIAGGLDMDAQAVAHRKAAQLDTYGWGGGTRESVYRLSMGTHWSKTGQLLSSCNGVAMKVSPLGALAAAMTPRRKEVYEFAMKLARMTHISKVAAASGLAQVAAVEYCLRTKRFIKNQFVDAVVNASQMAAGVQVMLGVDEPDITARFAMLNKRLTPKRINKETSNVPGMVQIPFSRSSFWEGSHRS